MPALPTGTVTFLFTDIEGSTRLLHDLGPVHYAAALLGHRRVLRDAFSRHLGVEVDNQGDAFFVAFSTAADAAAAAVEARDALAVGPIRARMGLHTGRPHVSAEGYVGEDVHKGARIAASAHGGQVVLSRETREVLDETFALTDLGEHRFKDFVEPVWIYQLGDERFAPLKTISNTNLPRPVSSLVGREREISEITSLLRGGARLVTLSGPGGAGKTRLAIEAAAELVPEFRNGVFWVPLAALSLSELVSPTIAQTIGAKNGLVEHIGQRDVLLVLDNLEQVIEAAPGLASLLESCPNLRLLVTSRQVLRVRGEVDYVVPPLGNQEAVELFAIRSRLTPDEAMSELCRRLDNLPLAVELAAARAGVMTPTQILARLSSRLDLLKGGRDAEARQRTIRATIEWSNDLLSPREQRLLARLSVFRGGWTLEAADDVCEAELDDLQSLVDQSLVRRRDERFSTLEMIRQFADERLAAEPEGEQIHARHAAHFLAMAEQAEPELTSRNQVAWLRRLDAESDNFRAALEWSLRAAPSSMLRLCALLWRFWFVRGRLEEGAKWLTDALELRDAARSRDRAVVLRAAGQLAYRRGRYAEAVSWNEAAMEMFLLLGDRAGVGWTLNQQADVAEALDELDRAEELWRDSVSAQREAGDRLGYAIAVGNLGSLVLARGDLDLGAALTADALAVHRELGNLHGAAIALTNLGSAARQQQRYDDALTLQRESLEILRELDSPLYVAHVMAELAAVSMLRGEAIIAAEHLGAVDRLLEQTGGNLSPDAEVLRTSTEQMARAALGAEALDAAMSRGGHRESQPAIEHALGQEDRS
jgi:predicted ATPase